MRRAIVPPQRMCSKNRPRNRRELGIGGELARNRREIGIGGELARNRRNLGIGGGVG